MSVTLNIESHHMSPLRQLLVEELRDLLHAEGQLVKALSKWPKWAYNPMARLKKVGVLSLHVIREGGDLLRADLLQVWIDQPIRV
jgi:hypothetical protein